MKYVSLLLSSVALSAFNNCPVVIIQTANGPVRLNASEYDPAIHTLVDGEEAPAPAPVVELPEVVAVVVDADAPAQPVSEAPAVVEPANPAPDEPAPVPAPSPAPIAPVHLVSHDKKAKRWFIVDNAGNRAVGDKIAVEGYATEKDAWDAVLVL